MSTIGETRCATGAAAYRVAAFHERRLVNEKRITLRWPFYASMASHTPSRASIDLCGYRLFLQMMPPYRLECLPSGARLPGDSVCPSAGRLRCAGLSVGPLPVN